MTQEAHTCNLETWMTSRLEGGRAYVAELAAYDSYAVGISGIIVRVLFNVIYVCNTSRLIIRKPLRLCQKLL